MLDYLPSDLGLFVVGGVPRLELFYAVYTHSWTCTGGYPCTTSCISSLSLSIPDNDPLLDQQVRDHHLVRSTVLLILVSLRIDVRKNRY